MGKRLNRLCLWRAFTFVGYKYEDPSCTRYIQMNKDVISFLHIVSLFGVHRVIDLYQYYNDYRLLNTSSARLVCIGSIGHVVIV